MHTFDTHPEFRSTSFIHPDRIFVVSPVFVFYARGFGFLLLQFNTFDNTIFILAFSVLILPALTLSVDGISITLLRDCCQKKYNFFFYFNLLMARNHSVDIDFSNSIFLTKYEKFIQSLWRFR